MSPKEKAEELIHYYIKELLSAKYSINGFVINDLAKQCALITVDEIFEAIKFIDTLEIEKNYWIEVKEEIEKF
jgi:hypothetical protein